MSHPASLAKRLGLSFKDQRLLEQALVHSSYLNENPGYPLASNERLEFLGDALVGLVAAQALYQQYQGLSEGELTALRAALVRGPTLARVAESLDLGNALLMGQGEETTGGRTRRSNLAAVYEALVGALFLDQGYEAAEEFVLRTMAQEIARLKTTGVPKDAKSRLQEELQAKGYSPPAYRLVDASGAQHDRRFTVEVVVQDEVVGRGIGRRKSEAEQEAAREALQVLEGQW